MNQKLIQSVIYLKYASDELTDRYPEISLVLLQLAQQIINDNNIDENEVNEFQNLVKETIENEKTI